MQKSINLSRVIIIAVALAVCMQTCALCYETNGFHGFYSIDTVKKHYGEKPLDVIAQIVPQVEMNDSWRSAVAATAFLGADAVPLMDRELTSALKSGNYQRASVIFDAYRRILDKRVFSQALLILRSAATTDLKVDALCAMQVHIRTSHWRTPSVVSEVNGYRLLSVSGVAYGTGSGESYSRGDGSVERSDILTALQELFTLQPGLEKENLKLAEQLQETIRMIDEKEQQYQDKLAEIEASNK